MLKIKKGSQVLIVSQCAYKDTFKKLRYQIINNSEEEAKKASSDEKIIDNQEEKLIEEEKANNEETKENEDIVTSENLRVNVIGENTENKNVLEFDEKESKSKTKSILEKALESKSNKPKRK